MIRFGALKMNYAVSYLITSIYFWFVALVNANLLNDGNFTTGDWGYWSINQDNNGTFSVVSPGHNTQYAGTHIVGTPGGYVAIIYPRIDVKPGKQYSWSLDYMLTNQDCYTEFVCDEATLMILGTSHRKATLNVWEHVHASFVALDHHEILTITTRCSENSTNTPNGVVAMFDNISVHEVSPLKYNTSSPPTGPNLIQQPSFDSGTFEAYNISHMPSASVSLISPGHDGAPYAAKISAAPASVRTSATITQFIEGVQKDQVYLFGASYAISAAANAEACILYAYAYEPGYDQCCGDFPSTGSFGSVNDSSSGSTGWLNFSVPLAALSDYFAINFNVACISDSASTIFDLDNIQFVPLSAHGNTS